VSQQVDKLAANRVTNGAAVVMDPKTGEIRALVGSKDWYDESFGKVNLATQPRQPGSSFKPIVYSLALQNREITAGTILHDVPTTFPGGYKPHDYDGKTRGNMTMRRALTNSLNIPAVEVMSKVGVPDTLEYAKQLGIDTLGDDASNYGLSLVLGAGEVPLVEMTNAYATFANNGDRNDPTTILEIKDKKDQVIYTHEAHPTQVVDPRVTYILSSILSDNKTRAETFGTQLNISRPAAVKTGTTENYVDAWTLGYTPNLVVGVWVGNNDHKPMDNIAGALGPAPIWRQLMEKFTAELPNESFARPDGIVTVRLCYQTTQTVEDKDNKDKKEEKQVVITGEENFIEGTEPKNSCGILTPTPNPSASPSPSPSVSPSPTPQNATPTNTPSPTATGAPTPTPTTVTIILTPTVVPTAATTPSPSPTRTP
jgi:membrane peptidoglycan carboxypeptidase